MPELHLLRAAEDCLGTDRYRAALYYMQQGWCVIPLAPKSKVPCKELLPVIRGRRSWKAYADRPATKLDIDYWFEQCPDINIGIITGTASNIVVADFDSATKLPMIETPIVKTGRGYHVYLAVDKPINSRKYSAGDLKAEGGYVVAPPSIHPDGSRYEWVDLFNPLTQTPAPFEDYADLLEEHLKGVARININLATPLGVQSGEGHYEHSVVKAEETPIAVYMEMAKDPEVAFKVMRAIGVHVDRIGKAFRCPLPGHSEKHPSAALWIPEGGRYIAMHDFHMRGVTEEEYSLSNDDKMNGKEWWMLPDVYASVKTGKARKLGRAERILWWLRALDEVGLIKKPELLARSIPVNAPEGARKLYNGFKYLLELRMLYDAGQRGAPLSYRFAAEWCGIGSQSTVKKAFAYLLQNGYLKLIEKKPLRIYDIVRN